MKITISDGQRQQVLWTKTYPPNFTSEQALHEQRWEFPLNSLHIAVEEIWFEGCHLLQAHLVPDQPQHFMLKVDSTLCSLLFVKSGSITMRCNDQHFTCSAVKGNLLCTQGCELLVEITEPVKLFSLQLSHATVQHLVLRELPLLAGMMAQAAQQPIIVVGRNLHITPLQQAVLDSLLQCEQTGFLKRIFLQAKVLELLFLHLDLHERTSGPSSGTSLKEYDVEKIYRAKSLLEQNLQNPCSLIELAHKVGLNDFKLKKGFKELMGTTVFGYLTDVRMEVAKNLLLEQRISVSEVSLEVGYKNPHHFTAAFKKRFGLLPSQLKR